MFNKGNEKVKRHYLTVLGTGGKNGYSEANYLPTELDGIEEPYCTKYIQCAVYKFYCRDFEEGDRITVFLTDDARKKSWEKNENGEGLRADISNIVKKGVAIEEVSIKDGKNEEEHWFNFNKIYECIDNNEEIIIDITHGFRVLPMQILVLLSFAKNIKNIRVRGIYYGAFEARNDRFTPILNYIDYMDVIMLGNGVNSFVKSGNSSELVEICEAEVKSKGRQFGAAKKGLIAENELKEIGRKKKFVDILSTIAKDVNDIVFTVETSRGKYNADSKSSIQKAYLRYKEDFASLNGNNTDESYKPIVEILNYMNKTIESVFGDLSEYEENVKTGLCAVKWCEQFNKIQSGITALKESLTSFVTEVTLGKKVVEDKNCRDKADYLLYLIGNNKTAEKNVAEIKKMKAILEKSLGIENSKALGKVAHDIKNMRNDVNHFGFSSKCDSYKTLNKNLTNYSNTIKEIIENYSKTEIENIHEEEPIRVFTHGGKFHADDVFGTALLKIVFEDNVIIERGFSIDKEYDIVYDIGYGEFDHHQRNKRIRNNGVPYAAFGLLWEKYGTRVMDEEGARIFDEKFIQPLDLNDNEGNCCTLADVIGSYNKDWQDKGDNSENFDKAVEFARDILERYIERRKSMYNANLQVKSLIDSCNEDILVMEKFIPWAEAVKNSHIKAVVYPSERGGFNGQLCDDMLFPMEWWGLSDRELEISSGIEGLRFCHSSGFMIAGSGMDCVVKGCKKAIKEIL